MFGILDVAHDLKSNIVFGCDSQGFLYRWNLQTIEQSHINIQENQQNNLLYKYSKRYEIQAQRLLIVDDKLYIANDKSLSYLLLSDLANDENIIPAMQFRERIINMVRLGDNVYVATTKHIQVIDSDHSEIMKWDIHPLDDQIDSFVQLHQEITCIIPLNGKSIAFGTNLGLVAVYDGFNNYVLQFNGHQSLSKVLSLSYNPDTQTLTSLHESYLVHWNLILEKEQEIIILDSEYTCIGKFNNQILFGGFEFNIKAKNTALQTSSEITYGLKSSDGRLFAHGSSLLIDVFKNSGYQLTLSAI